MRKSLNAIALVAVFAAFLPAQTADIPPSKEEVMKFLEIMHVHSQFVQYFNGIAKQARLGAEQGFKAKIPDATPEQLAKVDHFADNLFNDMPVDEMLDAMIPIYQKHLTKNDIGAILNFYSTPVGQKLLREQPAMMQEGMEAGGEIGRRRIGAMIQKMDQFVNDMVQDELKKKGAKQ
jgi:hypothetical protein